MSNYKYRLKFSYIDYFAWYVLPTIRFAIRPDGSGWFIALTWLKHDLLLSADKEKLSAV